MIDKAKFAEKVALIILEAGLRGALDMSDISDCATDAWLLADAMQAESDKRKVVGVPDVIRESRSLTKDKDGNCLHFHHEFGHRRCMDCGASLKAWQPDWSQAPTDDITHWSKEGDGVCTWWIGEPTLADDCHCENNFGSGCSVFGDAPDFGYKGDWRDSLRKRPE